MATKIYRTFGNQTRLLGLNPMRSAFHWKAGEETSKAYKLQKDTFGIHHMSYQERVAKNSNRSVIASSQNSLTSPSTQYISDHLWITDYHDNRFCIRISLMQVYIKRRSIWIAHADSQIKLLLTPKQCRIMSRT
jgi:hypothetical protein